ncbi:MAG: leucine-rich repeat domain-containing protein [Erysipelotrichales bacterium]|nr:leucine-rich repeat domain-containing protein [Erysipelotrichales bacterium]
MNNFKNRKLLPKALLLMFLVMSLGACGKKTNSSSTSTSVDTSAPGSESSVGTSGGVGSNSSSNSTIVNEDKKFEDIDQTLPNIDVTQKNFKTRDFVTFPTFTTDRSEAVKPNTFLYSENLSYELSEDGSHYIVKGFAPWMEAGNDVYIKPYIGDIPVTEIATESFGYKWYVFNIYIPHTITNIGAGAFNACGIKNLYYDGNVEDFLSSNWIFYPQDSATTPPNNMVQNIDIVIGPNVTRIPGRFMLPLGTHATYVPNVKSLRFCKDSKVTSIGEYAFYNSAKLKELYLPDSLTSIENHAFYNTSIEELYLPDNLVSIGEQAFMMDDDIKMVRFPSSLKSIGYEAFYANKSLEYVDLFETKIETLEDAVFKECSNLKNVVLPNSLKEINDSVFENDISLKFIDILNSVESIGMKAFANCESMSYIRLGENLKNIGNECFKNNVKLSRLIINSKEIQDLPSNNKIFINCGKESGNLEVLFTSSVKSIAKRMFFSSALLDESILIKRLDLSAGLEKVNDYAIYNCRVETLVFNGTAQEFGALDISNLNELPSEVNCRGGK